MQLKLSPIAIECNLRINCTVFVIVDCNCTLCLARRNEPSSRGLTSRIGNCVRFRLFFQIDFVSTIGKEFSKFNDLKFVSLRQPGIISVIFSLATLVLISECIKPSQTAFTTQRFDTPV